MYGGEVLAAWQGDGGRGGVRTEVIAPKTTVFTSKRVLVDQIWSTTCTTRGAILPGRPSLVYGG